MLLLEYLFFSGVCMRLQHTAPSSNPFAQAKSVSLCFIILQWLRFGIDGYQKPDTYLPLHEAPAHPVLTEQSGMAHPHDVQLLGLNQNKSIIPTYSGRQAVSARYKHHASHYQFLAKLCSQPLLACPNNQIEQLSGWFLGRSVSLNGVQLKEGSQTASGRCWGHIPGANSLDSGVTTCNRGQVLFIG